MAEPAPASPARRALVPTAVPPSAAPRGPAPECQGGGGCFKGGRERKKGFAGKQLLSFLDDFLVGPRSSSHRRLGQKAWLSLSPLSDKEQESQRVEGGGDLPRLTELFGHGGRS